MSRVNKLIETQTPFAVMQYFESFKGSKRETNRVYELTYLNSKKLLSFKVLNKNEIAFLKSNPDKIKLVITNDYGSVYEFNDFKNYHNENKIKESKNVSKRKKQRKDKL